MANHVKTVMVLTLPEPEEAELLSDLNRAVNRIHKGY